MAGRGVGPDSRWRSRPGQRKSFANCCLPARWIVAPDVVPGERWVPYLQSPASLDGRILAGGLQSAARVGRAADGADVVGNADLESSIDRLPARDQRLLAERRANTAVTEEVW